MAFEELCMYCFEDREGRNICPHCGRDARAAVPQIQMLPGTLIYHERFLVGRALGQDASGIVYAALDTRKKNKLRIREYMPRDCAERLPDGSVAPIAGMEDRFDRGMERLRASVEDVEEGQKRHFYFEEYGTAYIAQRKGAQAAAHAEEAKPERSGAKQLAMILGIAAAVVAAAVLAIVLLVNNTMEETNEVLQNRTPDPTVTATATPTASASWAPISTPTASARAASTFAPLVDPDRSWLDYTNDSSVQQDLQRPTQGTQSVQSTATPRSIASTATPAPTINPQTTPFNNTVSGNSTQAAISSLQQRLVQLGWLGASGVSGRYDDATRQAVRDFQNYVNRVINPTEKLAVDGIAGPKTQQWLYGTDSRRPTATPTAVVTPDPEQALTVDANSSRAEIRAVQRKLIALGLLSTTGDDGIYSTQTTNAVRSFQARVNQLQGYTVLSLTGRVDPETMSYLNYYVDLWEELRLATATPRNRATATPRPTATPTPAPDIPEDNTVVDRNSPKESIQYLQQQLIQVGLLSSGSDDGIFGSGTANALVRFQQWINANFGEGTVPVTGQGDAITLAYLETASADGVNAAATPTPGPTEAPTEEPAATDVPDVPEDNVVVDRNSPAESIRYVQQMLMRVGLLGAGADDGILGGGTSRAVIAFQEYVNSVYGAGTLNENGTLDQETLGFLETASAQGVVIGDRATPTPAPAAHVDVDLSLSNTSNVNGVYVADGDSIEFNWGASGPVEGYYIYITNSEGNLVYQIEATDQTRGRFNRSDLNENEVYRIEIGALPQGGTQEDMTWIDRSFSFSAGAASEVETPAPEVTPEPARLESVDLSINGSISTGLVEVDGDSVRLSWQARGDVASYSVTITDSTGRRLYSLDDTTTTSGTIRREQMVPGEVYTITVGARPAGEGDVVWTEARFTLPASEEEQLEPEATATAEPEAAEPVTSPNISISGTSYQQDGVRYLTGSQATFSWSSSGDVREYRIYVRGESGRSNSDVTIGTSKQLNLNSLQPGVYRLYVGAVPVDAQSDDDIVWSNITFGVPGMVEADDDPSREADFDGELDPDDSVVPQPDDEDLSDVTLQNLEAAYTDPAQEPSSQTTGFNVTPQEILEEMSGAYTEADDE